MTQTAQKQETHSHVSEHTNGNFDLEPSSGKDFAVLHANTKTLAQDAARELQERGCVIIRGLISDEALLNLQEKVDDVMHAPSLSGSYGYYQKDCHKKLYDPLLLGKEVVDLYFDERILDCMKAYCGEEMLLAEIFMKRDLGTNDVYFPLHSDVFVGGSMGRNNEDANYDTSADLMKTPFAIGGICYLEDTTDGAFCYAEGTHHWGATLGGSPADYPKEVQDKIAANTIRAEGQAGDYIMFDDRGFHGPEQPSKAQRTVLICDFVREGAFGRVVKSPPPVLVPHISHLSQRQLNALGWGCIVNTPFKEHHTRTYNKHFSYRFIKHMLNGVFKLEQMKARLRVVLKGHKTSYLPKTYANKK